LLFDILRCATLLKGLSPSGPIKIRKQGITANYEFGRPWAKDQIVLDMSVKVRYFWKVRAKTPVDAVIRKNGERNKFEDTLA
jgi:hypothetical protein